MHSELSYCTPGYKTIHASCLLFVSNDPDVTTMVTTPTPSNSNSPYNFYGLQNQSKHVGISAFLMSVYCRTALDFSYSFNTNNLVISSENTWPKHKDQSKLYSNSKLSE